jgi:hypothetical protein
MFSILSRAPVVFRPADYQSISGKPGNNSRPREGSPVPVLLA